MQAAREGYQAVSRSTDVAVGLEQIWRAHPSSSAKTSSRGSGRSALVDRREEPTQQAQSVDRLWPPVVHVALEGREGGCAVPEGLIPAVVDIGLSVRAPLL